MKLEASDIADLEPLLEMVVSKAVAKILAEQPPVENGDGRLCYSEQEAAEKIGIQIHVLRAQRKLGRIAFTRIGRRIEYTKTDLQTYLEKNRTPATDARA